MLNKITLCLLRTSTDSIVQREKEGCIGKTQWSLGQSYFHLTSSVAHIYEYRKELKMEYSPWQPNANAINNKTPQIYNHIQD